MQSHHWHFLSAVVLASAILGAAYMLQGAAYTVQPGWRAYNSPQSSGFLIVHSLTGETWAIGSGGKHRVRVDGEK